MSAFPAYCCRGASMTPRLACAYCTYRHRDVAVKRVVKGSEEDGEALDRQRLGEAAEAREHVDNDVVVHSFGQRVHQAAVATVGLAQQ